VNIDFNTILLLVIVIEIGLVYFKITQVVEEQPEKLRELQEQSVD
jgi:hypothetical protein